MILGTDRLAQLVGEIEAEMRAARVPGLALAIVRETEVYATGLGVTGVEDGGLQVTPQTLFRIGSTTKAMTGTMIMRLVEAGRLELDRPLREYLPWLTFSEPGAAGRVTLRLLLTHSSGLPHDSVPFGGRDPETLGRYVREQLPRYTLVAPPGTLLSYSNPGLSLAGYVAEAVCGRPYAELMQEWLFTPLEMVRTTFDPTVAMTYPLAQGHQLRPDGTLGVVRRFPLNVAFQPPGLCTFSTALDLARFVRLHLQQGRYGQRRLLQPQSVAAMHARQVETYDPTNEGHGLTFILESYRGLRRVSHPGATGTFGCELKLAPEAGIGVVLLCNRFQEFRKASRATVDRIFDALLDSPAAVPVPRGHGHPVVSTAGERARWPRYGGTYAGWWTGLATVRVLDDGLTLALNQGPPLRLRPVRAGLYETEASPGGAAISVGFVPAGDGPAEYLMVDTLPCRRVGSALPTAPDPEAWAAYAGRYEAPLDTLTVRVSNPTDPSRARLTIHSRHDDETVDGTPLGANRFACKWGLVEFRVSPDGRAASLKAGQLKRLEPVTFTRTATR